MGIKSLAYVRVDFLCIKCTHKSYEIGDTGNEV